jgi:hypothetical protein
MKFIEIIIANSQLKESKLFYPSKKASENPTIGITIQNQAAFHVIKDCAKIAHRYLPLVVMEHYPNVFSALKGKFEKQDIINFVEAAQKDLAYKQLLDLLLDKLKKTFPTSDGSQGIEFTTSSFSQTANDPYGDYGSFNEPVNKVEDKNPVELLWEAFN